MHIFYISVIICKCYNLITTIPSLLISDTDPEPADAGGADGEALRPRTCGRQHSAPCRARGAWARAHWEPSQIARLQEEGQDEACSQDVIPHLRKMDTKDKAQVYRLNIKMQFDT